MNTYPYPRNTSVMRASANIESVRPLSNDEARAAWASKYYSRGLHRGNGKPRIRVTVPQPLPQSARRAGSFPGTNYDVASASVQTADTFNADLRSDSAQLLPSATAALVGSPLPSGISCDREHEHSAGRQSIPYVPPPEDIGAWNDYVRRVLAGEILPF